MALDCPGGLLEGRTWVHTSEGELRPIAGRPARRLARERRDDAHGAGNHAAGDRDALRSVQGDGQGRQRGACSARADGKRRCGRDSGDCQGCEYKACAHPWVSPFCPPSVLRASIPARAEI